MNRAPGLRQGSCHASRAWTRLRFPDTLGLLWRDRSGLNGHGVSSQGASDQDVSECRAGELTALIRVEDPRLRAALRLNDRNDLAVEIIAKRIIHLPYRLPH